jgi:hypothetical protein
LCKLRERDYGLSMATKLMVLYGGETTSIWAIYFLFFILFWIVFGMVLSHLFFSLNKMTVMSLCVFSHTRHNQGHFGKLMIIPNIAKQVKSCRLIK